MILVRQISRRSTQRPTRPSEPIPHPNRQTSRSWKNTRRPARRTSPRRSPRNSGPSTSRPRLKLTRLHLLRPLCCLVIVVSRTPKPLSSSPSPLHNLLTYVMPHKIKPRPQNPYRVRLKTSFILLDINHGSDEKAWETMIVYINVWYPSPRSCDLMASVWDICTLKFKSEYATSQSVQLMQSR